MNNITIKKAKIKDIRGEKYPGCHILIDNGKAYFAGYRVKELRRSENTTSQYLYDIILNTLEGLNAGTIALKHNTAEFINNLNK